MIDSRLIRSSALFVFLLSFTFFTKAQITIDPVNAESFVQEIYLECPIYQNQEQIDRASEVLGRILIHEVALGEYPECPLLSEVGHKNKCNPNLDYSTESFDPVSFNPLKYHMKFYAESAVYYRVDGQNYIIEIQPRQ